MAADAAGLAASGRRKACRLRPAPRQSTTVSGLARSSVSPASTARGRRPFSKRCAACASLPRGGLPSKREASASPLRASARRSDMAWPIWRATGAPTAFFPHSRSSTISASSRWARDLRLGFIDRRRQRARYETYRRRLTIVAPRRTMRSPRCLAETSRRCCSRAGSALGPRVLLLNDPTRGVDQRTREALYQVFRELAHDEGMALVVLSTEIEEILRLCDRVLVFREQRVDRAACRR